MSEIFNYSTFTTSLEKSTRTLFINFSSDKRLGLERLFELESLFSWLTNKVEINSVVISSMEEEFLGDWNEHSAQLSDSYIKKIVTKVRKLNQAMIHLPQTFIFDLGLKASSIALELAAGADIRVASLGCDIRFNHLEQGIMPAAGTLSLLGQIIPNALLKSWILSSKKISEYQLQASGFVFEFYDETNYSDCLASICHTISNQSPIQRIQTKMGLIETTRLNFEQNANFEEKLFNASMISQDWKNLTDDNFEYLSSKSMNEILRQSGIQKQTNNNPGAEIKPFRRPDH